MRVVRPSGVIIIKSQIISKLPENKSILLSNLTEQINSNHSCYRSNQQLQRSHLKPHSGRWLRLYWGCMGRGSGGVVSLVNGMSSKTRIHVYPLNAEKGCNAITINYMICTNRKRRQSIHIIARESK